MNQVNFNLEALLDDVHPKTIESGYEYFTLKKVSDLTFNAIADEISVNAICNKYKNNIEIIGDEIKKSYCQCFIGSKDVICKHIVATILELDKKANKSDLSFYGIKLKNYHEYIVNNNIGSYIKLFANYKKINNLHFYNIAIKENDLIIEINENDVKWEYDKLVAFYEFIKRIDDKEQIVKKIKNNINTTINIYEKFFKEQNRNIKSVIFDDEIDHFFEILMQKKYEEPYLWINMMYASKDLGNFIQFNKKEVENINVKIIKTNLGYAISADIEILKIFSTSKYAYIIYLDSNKKLTFAQFNNKHLIEIKNLMKNIDSVCKERVLFKKINELKEIKCFNVNINDADGTKQDLLEMNFYLDEHNNKIKVSIENDDINSFIFNNNLVELSPFFSNENKSTTFDSIDKLMDFYAIVKKPMYEQKIILNVPDVITKILNHKKEDINFDFSLQNDKIKMQLSIENKLIDNAIVKKIISSNQMNKSKNLGFLKIGNNFSLNVNAINVKKLSYYLNILSPNKETFNQVNINKIFYIAKEFKLDSFIDFANAFEKHEEKLDLDAEILSKLKPYQLYGVKWIKKMLNFASGCILADEMGLGKTFQSIAYINDYQKTEKKPVLIITPFSLIHNWKNEFKKFASDNKINEIEGNNLKREEQINKIKDNEIYITNYHKFISDFKLYQKKEFGLVILDEGQYIKNKNSKWTKNIKTIKSDKRLILTGTPIENNILEIWSLFEFIMPNYLPNEKLFRQFFSTKDTNSLNELAFLIKPFILQRKKIDELPDLPDKENNLIMIKMNSQEEETYNNLYSQIKNEVSIFFENKDNNKKNEMRMNILSLITKLRQYCCDPHLLNYYSINGSKIKKCLSIIKEISKNKNNKIAIFSSFTSLLDNLNEHLKNNGYKTLVLTGKNSQKERAKMIDEFNCNNDIIFLISLKAGGVGINLNTANVVIHYNPWWNDSVENQATDRLHRIGQKQKVIIYNLILKNSIEEKILNIKKQKNSLINTTITSADYIELFKLINKKN